MGIRKISSPQNMGSRKKEVSVFSLTNSSDNDEDQDEAVRNEKDECLDEQEEEWEKDESDMSESEISQEGDESFRWGKNVDKYYFHGKKERDKNMKEIEKIEAEEAEIYQKTRINKWHVDIEHSDIEDDESHDHPKWREIVASFESDKFETEDLKGDDSLKIASEMKEILRDIDEQNLQRILDYIKYTNDIFTTEGHTFLMTKMELWLLHVIYLSYYLLCKLEGVSTDYHPVLDRLREIKIMIDKMRPINDKVKSQITALLNMKFDEDVAKPENLIEEVPGADEIYKPPKVIAMHYDNDTSLRSRLNRGDKEEILKDIRKELDEKPQEIGVMSFDMEKEDEIEEEEMEMYKRVMKDNTKDRKKELRSKELQDIGVNLNKMVEDVEEIYLEDVANTIGSMKAKKREPFDVDNIVKGRKGIKKTKKQTKEKVKIGSDVSSEEIIDDLDDNCHGVIPSIIHDNSINSQRTITKAMKKNRGLTRIRRKSEKTPRTKLRHKYEKKMKQYNMCHPGKRDATVDGGYSGEHRGLATHIVKSRRFNR